MNIILLIISKKRIHISWGPSLLKGRVGEASEGPFGGRIESRTGGERTRHRDTEYQGGTAQGNYSNSWGKISDMWTYIFS